MRMHKHGITKHLYVHRWFTIDGLFLQDSLKLQLSATWGAMHAGTLAFSPQITITIIILELWSYMQSAWMPLESFVPVY